MEEFIKDLHDVMPTFCRHHKLEFSIPQVSAPKFFNALKGLSLFNRTWILVIFDRALRSSAVLVLTFFSDVSLSSLFCHQVASQQLCKFELDLFCYFVTFSSFNLSQVSRDQARLNSTYLSTFCAHLELYSLELIILLFQRGHRLKAFSVLFF